MKNFQKIFYSIFAIYVFSCSSENLDAPFKISSPNNSLTATVSVDGGLPNYSLTFNGTPIVDRSRLGIKTDKLLFSNQLEVIKVKRRSKDNSWEQVWGEQKIVRDIHNELELTLLCTVEKNKMILRFRMFDDGIGFRYEIPRQNKISDFTILDELTEFNLSEDSPSWWIPAYAYRRYEFLYAKTLISEISRDKFSELVENLSGPRIGPEAVQTPFTTQRKDGTVITIHEANLANYSSMALKATGTKNLECDLFPWSDGTKVKTSAPMQSPWRTIIVGANPSDIVMSTLTLNLNEPNKLSNTSWIEPGKYIGVWWEMIGTHQSTWGSGPHHSAKTEKVMKYIDFGSEHGFDGVLVEGWNKGWDQNWCCNGEGEDFGFYHPHPDFDHKLVRNYAKEKNIRIVGHHETGTQIENYESQLDSAFAYCKRNGIRVVKTGYVNDGSKNIKRTGADGKIYKEWHHGQYMVEHFRKVLETAAKYEVSIVVHEPIKDTGLRRTYPNMVSREGARGQEFNGFMGINDNNKPNHTTILPFTRLVSGPMDYTSGIFNLTEYRYFAPDNRKINLNHQIPSTISKELALYVVIYAPVQMAADLPENYEGHPAFQFIKDVPTDWETSICVNGEIGEYITMVRKDINSDDWYLGSITNENSRALSVSLSFLDADKQYNATVYKDPEAGGWKKRPEEVVIQSQLVDSGSDLGIVIPSGGGQAIRFSPVN